MPTDLIRVGHKGADLIAPGNTEASFAAAREAGVDVIEFDVMPAADGRLVLAHDPGDAAGRRPLSLEEGLDVLAGYEGIGLDVDLKRPGYERAVLDALAERDLLGRSLISSTFPESLELIGEAAPGVRRGLSVPRAQRDYTKSLLLALPAYAVLRWWRAGLPARAARLLAAGAIEAVMAHRLLVSAHLVERIHREGGELYVWTVDDATEIARLEALGVDAVITNDPRLFAALPGRDGGPVRA